MTKASGIPAIIAACTIWGLSPVYYKWLAHVPAWELMLHRSFWSLVIFTAVLALKGRLSALASAFATRRALGITVFAAAMVSVNWFLFIWAVIEGRTTETSLGYYIFPLVSVLIGVLWLRERLSGLQWAAVTLACGGVLVLAVGQGAPPWLALTVAISFALYGLVKKGLALDPLVSVTAECWVLGAPSLLALAIYHAQGQGVFGQEAVTSGLLVFSGLLTAFPLMLFSYGAQRARLATVGLVQYLNPTLQFFCAVVLFAEPFGPLHGVTFGLIWMALALYSLAAFRQDRARRRASSASLAEPSTDTNSNSEASAKP